MVLLYGCIERDTAEGNRSDRFILVSGKFFIEIICFQPC